EHTTKSGGRGDEVGAGREARKGAAGSRGGRLVPHAGAEGARKGLRTTEGGWRFGRVSARERRRARGAHRGQAGALLHHRSLPRLAGGAGAPRDAAGRRVPLPARAGLAREGAAHAREAARCLTSSRDRNTFPPTPAKASPMTTGR